MGKNGNSLTPVMVKWKLYPAPVMTAVQGYRVFAHPVNYLSLKSNVHLISECRP